MKFKFNHPHNQFSNFWDLLWLLVTAVMLAVLK